MFWLTSDSFFVAAMPDARRSPTAFMLWWKANKDAVGKGRGASKKAGEMWAAMADEEKKPWTLECEALKVAKDEELSSLAKQHEQQRQFTWQAEKAVATVIGMGEDPKTLQCELKQEVGCTEPVSRPY